MKSGIKPAAAPRPATIRDMFGARRQGYATKAAQSRVGGPREGTMSQSHTIFHRRELLIGAGAFGLASVPIVAACAQQRPAARSAALIAGETCPLTPRQTEGPFYFDPALVRQDIREGRPGVPL